MRQTTLALIIVPLLCGCFTYIPLELNAVAPDMSIRVRVTEDASRLMGATRDAEIPIEGTVFNVTGSQLSLLPELGTAAVTEPISLNFSDIRVLERREISQTKTWAMVAGGMAAAILVVLAVDDNLFGGAGPGGPGDFAILPWIRLPSGR